MTIRAELLPSYHWRQLVGDQLFDIRAVVPPTQSCPLVQQDHGGVVPMSVRAEPSALFPVRVCQYHYQAGEHPHLLSEDHFFPAPLSRVAFIADTACAIGTTLPCPEQSVLHQVMMTALYRQSPDLIVHLGGLLSHTRQDRWPSWERDWFHPALSIGGEQAVFLFVRGPEARCRGAWRGWARFFAAEPSVPLQCSAWQETWYAHWGYFYGVMVDGSLLSQQALSLTRHRIDQWHLDTLYHRPWLITYPPLWGYTRDRHDHLMPVSSLYRQALGDWVLRNSSVLWGADPSLNAVVRYEGLPVQLTTGGFSMGWHPSYEHLSSEGGVRVSHFYCDQRPGYWFVVHGAEEPMNRLWHVSWHALLWNPVGQAWGDRVLASLDFQARTFTMTGPVPDRVLTFGRIGQ